MGTIVATSSSPSLLRKRRTSEIKETKTSYDDGEATKLKTTHDAVHDDDDDTSSTTNSRFIYFNNAGQGRFSDAVQQAGIKALRKPPWKMVALEEERHVRCMFAKLIGASHEISTGGGNTAEEVDDGKDIAVMPSTAFAITLAAHNIARLYKQKYLQQQKELKHQQQKQQYQKKETDRTATTQVYPQHVKVLVLQDQYPSAIYPWQEICDAKTATRSHHKHASPSRHDSSTHPHSPVSASNHSNGSGEGNNHVTWSIHVVPYPEDEYGTLNRTWTESIVEHLSKSSNRHAIQAVMLPPLHWADGRVIDLDRIGKICRKREIPLIVDATQAVGIYPVNIRAIQPALLACSTHKWLRGPSGTSLVYVNPEIHDSWKPLDQHERGRDMSKSDYFINAATRGHFMNPKTGCYPEPFSHTARKFDAGGKANPLLIPMLEASLQEVVQINVQQAQESLKELMQPLLKWCHDHDFIIPPQPHAYHLIGIQPPPYIFHQQQNPITRNDQPCHSKNIHYHQHHLERLSPQQLVQVANFLGKEYNILLQARCGGFRVAPYLDTRPQDVQRLIDALDDAFFGSGFYK